jgi:hypothetical protein
MFAGGGSISTVFTSAPGGADAFSTFILPSTFTNLASVTFAGSPRSEDATSNFALDNLVVNVLPHEVEATAVPEPSTLALFASCLLGIGFASRRRLPPTTAMDNEVLETQERFSLREDGET